MTSAPQLRGLDPRDEMLCELVSNAIKKRQRAARKSGDPTLTQERISFEVFGHNQQWLSRRLVGEIAFTPAELLDVGDWLEVNVVEWLDRAKALYPSPTGGSTTAAYPPPYLTVLDGEAEFAGLWEPLEKLRLVG